MNVVQDHAQVLPPYVKFPFCVLQEMEASEAAMSPQLTDCCESQVVKPVALRRVATRECKILWLNWSSDNAFHRLN